MRSHSVKKEINRDRNWPWLMLHHRFLISYIGGDSISTTLLGTSPKVSSLSSEFEFLRCWSTPFVHFHWMRHIFQHQLLYLQILPFCIRYALSSSSILSYFRRVYFNIHALSPDQANFIADGFPGIADVNSHELFFALKAVLQFTHLRSLPASLTGIECCRTTQICLYCLHWMTTNARVRSSLAVVAALNRYGSITIGKGGRIARKQHDSDKRERNTIFKVDHSSPRIKTFGPIVRACAVWYSPFMVSAIYFILINNQKNPVSNCVLFALTRMVVCECQLSIGFSFSPSNRIIVGH